MSLFPIYLMHFPDFCKNNLEHDLAIVTEGFSQPDLDYTIALVTI